MEQVEIEELKEYLMEMDPCIEFDEKNEEKLLGYAERFGGSIILMYKDVNTFLVDEPSSTMDTVGLMNPKARKADGFEDTIIGYIIIDNEEIILHDREKMIEKK